jgi:serine/threonine protein kinase
MTEPNSSMIAKDQDVLGYTLRERIGSGGYGEVWSAEAPGGMLKAVKFIYGFHDDNRAQRELKAIDRIKHIRHPFLLSLERIDIVDGRMVVITELADMCLKTRFNQCREAGLDAIPRDELLQYLRESAEALDYISEVHALAHLDIKPENLLIVGSHVKVADFGLVKDLHSVNQSLMDGLTPAYAAPELFDGRPHKSSDQYSLAIVYQELLTATRPFSGTTAAQLANQHLHSWPNLNSLPRSDQAVIARALSKDPEKRFPNCRAMTDELTKRRGRLRIRNSEAAQALRTDAHTSAMTRFNDEVPARYLDQTGTLSESFVPAMNCEGPLESLDPFSLDESRSTVRPTLFIGIGNTGVQVLRKLKRRMAYRFGSTDQTPALRFLAIDVDRRTLFDRESGDEAEILRGGETLHIPLRRPEDYRNDSNIDLSWIGRRWIYNVPKSRLTESLRPLGRLAFVDHHDSLYRRVADELTHLKREEHLATTAETVALMPSSLSPQVVVVSSVSGGTGSGMVLDLAYSLRIAMSEQGLSNDNIYGVFTHGTSRQQSDHRLSVANSCAFLKELNHYNLNGYPGNPGCGIPEFTNETPAYDGVYFLDLGEDQRESGYDDSMEFIAHYLFLSTVTRCTGFFERCRHPEGDDSQVVRTMSVACIGKNHDRVSSETANVLANRVFQRWLEPLSREDAAPRIPVLARQIMSINEIDDASLDSRVRGILADALGGDANRKILEIVENKLLSKGSSALDANAAVDKVLDQLLVGRKSSGTMNVAAGELSFAELVDTKSAVMTRGKRDDLREALFGLFDVPEIRLGGAKQVGAEILGQLQQLEIAVETEGLRHSQTAEECRQRLQTTGREKKAQADPAKIHQLIREQVASRISAFVCGARKKILQTISADVSRILEAIDELGRQFDNLWQRPRQSAAAPKLEEGEEHASLSQLLEQQIRKAGHEDPGDLESLVNERVLEPAGGLRAIITEGPGQIRKLPAEIRAQALLLVSRDLQLLDIDSVVNQVGDQLEQIAACVDRIVREATPSLATCGGSRRLLIAVPQRAPLPFIADILQKKMELDANVIPATCGELVVCTEMGDLPIEHIAAKILLTQPDCAELIERIPSRMDVAWSSVIPLC